jgi:CelD/BcsL family acetyltransferase involved in cellulose biosynthesis
VVRCLDDPFGQFAGLLLEPGRDASQFVGAVIKALSGRADALRIEQVPAFTPLAQALAVAGADVVDHQQAVFIDLRPFQSYAEFQQATSAKMRKILRNMRTRLEREYEVSLEMVSSKADLFEPVSFAFSERVEWMKRNGRTSPAFQTERFSDLITNLGEARVQTVAFSLKANGQIASSQFGFVFGDSYYAYMSAMRPEFHDFSAGRIHLGKVIEACFSRGIRVLELMPPASRYKLEWNGTTKELETVALAISFRGWVYLYLQNQLLPLARRMSRLLPHFLRRILINRMNRN